MHVVSTVSQFTPSQSGAERGRPPVAKIGGLLREEPSGWDRLAAFLCRLPPFLCVEPCQAGAYLPVQLQTPPCQLRRIPSCLLTTTRPTDDSDWTMGLADLREWFICKTKIISYCWQQRPFLPPPPGGEQSVSVPRSARLDSPWVALICMHAASPTEHSSQVREVGGKRGKQNLIFMVN